MPMPEPAPRRFASPVGWWRAAVAARPEAVAVVDFAGSATGHLTDRRALTYRQMDIAVSALANRLRDARAEGGRVALLLPNGGDFLVALYAALTAGAQAALLNPGYTPRELTPVLADADPAIVLIPPGRDDLAALVSSATDAACWPMAVADLLDEGEGTGAGFAPPDPDSLAILQYTGGTTGLPKGVDLTHRAVAANVAQREAWVRHPIGTERVLAVTPLFHAYGMANGAFLAPYCQGCLILPPRYRPDWTLELIDAEGVTVFAGAPTVYTGLLDHPALPTTDFSALSVCYSGGAPLAAETLARWEAAVGAPIFEGYGQTECGPVIAYNPKDGPFAGRRPGTIGYPVPETAVRIVDPRDGRTEMPTGEPGELLVRGPQIMVGYRNRPDATGDAFIDGWLRTGDIVRRRPDGALVIEDRRSDMVLTGGFNVYPREIDEVLAGHPDVAAVVSVGVPDRYYGQVVWSYVVPLSGRRPTEADLQRHAEAGLAKYKRPRRILLVDDLPRTTVGKIDKRRVRAIAEAALDPTVPLDPSAALQTGAPPGGGGPSSPRDD